MSKKKNRGQLYDKFRQGSIPTGADFADLIRSGVNFVDDGMDIPETDALLPIKIRGRSEYNHIFDFCDNQWNLQWRLSQVSNDEQVSETTRHGLNFSSNSTSRLFIEQEFGNLGLSNEEPQARLHIRQLGSQDCFRIDDEASDLSPFIIDSTGALGLGTLSPQAVFHLTNSSVNDSVRIDDQSSDDTPFVIQKDGNVGIGYDSTNVKVAINGGLNVGNTNDPGDKNASIQGNLHVHTDTQLGDDDQHKVVMPAKLQSVETPNASSKVEINDSLQINENLTVKKNVLLEGTLTVNGDVITKDTEHVLGNVILGDEDSDTITVTGTMISGHSSGKLEIDDAVNIKQTLEVAENIKLSGSTLINEFLENMSLGGGSNGALPTERAVKLYVDDISNSLNSQINELKALINAVDVQMSAIKASNLSEADVAVIATDIANVQIGKLELNWGVQNQTPWLNEYDQEFDTYLPRGEVVVGLHSVHANGQEDRKFAYNYRSLNLVHNK